ncbi:MAG: hypothetical protein AAF725_17860, partial [Acidobacteriota bacterium]
SILVSVALDHQDFLGETLAEIARDKAGILRSGKTAVLGQMPREAFLEVERVARHRSARLLDARRARLEPRGGGRADLTTPNGQRYRLAPGLLGEHQMRNARLAILAAEQLRSLFPSIDGAACERGIATARLPCRLEWLELPRAGKRSRGVLLDGAHNPDAVRCLESYLAGLGEPCDLLFGAFRDKDAGSMLEILRPRVERIWLTSWEHPRAWRRGDAASGALSRGWEWVSSPQEGLRRAAAAGPARPLVVAGSLSLVSRVRERIVSPDPPEEILSAPVSRSRTQSEPR